MKLNGLGSIILKLLLATVVGLVLGLEREAKHKPLGIKTCVVVSIASCLLTIVSIEFVVNAYKGVIFSGADPLRLPSQIISGIGFLGAGVILRKDNNMVYGLTTAAIVWTAAGLGIATGLGYYLEVGIATGLIYLTVIFLPLIMRKIGPDSLKQQEVYLRIYVDAESVIETVVEKIEALVMSIENVKIKSNGEHQRIDMRCFIEDNKGNIFAKYDKIKKINGIKKVEISKI